jgi:hypothetical protein
MSSRVSFARRAVCALTVLAALQSWGAEPLTLAEAQRLALGRSQQLAANDASASAARRMAQAAAQLPDPVLKFGVDNLPLSGADRFSLTRDFMTMRRIGVMQELPGADKRRLRGQRGAQEALKVQAEREMVRVGLLRGTAQAWADRYYALASRELVLRQLVLQHAHRAPGHEHIGLAALAAAVGGKGDLASVLAARRDELELRIQALAAELETARAWASLNFITADHDMPASQGSQP